MKYLTGKILAIASLAILSLSMPSCVKESDEPDRTDVTEQPENPEQPDDNEDDNDGQLPEVPVTLPEFAKGADVSWLTELEDKGYVFFAPDGNKAECMQLLRDCYGLNSIRLRVWVNPSDRYNSIQDVMVKARRAHDLGLSLMIDFHLSDTWADPANQTVPAAWIRFTPEQLCEAIKGHVNDLLSQMLEEGIAPAWVQIGNETSQGMLFPSGKMSGSNAAEFPRYLNAGYEAVKALSPNTKVIVHLPNGYDTGLYTWFFDLVERHGGKYDMIGMSLYPETETWPMETIETQVDECISNIGMLGERYGKDVMICETGFHYSRGEEAFRVIRKIIDNADNGRLKGIFYWEPEAPEHYNGGYDKGCFVNGCPNKALEAFKQTR